MCCREKKLAAKAQGRRHASSEEDESEDEGASQVAEGEQDPFFQHEDNPFDDPFFKVSLQTFMQTANGFAHA